MSLLYLFVLAVVQGITEFLPISSSAHLILVPQVLGETDQGLVIDVAVHVGTLLAVLAYFRAEVAGMLHGLMSYFYPEAHRTGDRRNRHLARAVVIGAVPVGLMARNSTRRSQMGSTCISNSRPFSAIIRRAAREAGDSHK